MKYAKTREVKLCTVWSGEVRDAEGRLVRDDGSVSYTATIESAATLEAGQALAAFTQLPPALLTGPAVPAHSRMRLSSGSSLIVLDRSTGVA